MIVFLSCDMIILLILLSHKDEVMSINKDINY